MSINWKYVMGVTTIVGVVAFTAYAIKKSKEQKNIEEESITAEEAMAFVKAHNDNIEPKDTNVVAGEFKEWFDDPSTWSTPIVGAKETDELMDDIKKTESVKDDRLENLEIEDVDIRKPEFSYEGIDFEVPFIETMTEEDKVLRYEPSSDEARKQFIKMELAEWTPKQDPYLIMLDLFNVPFNPENDGDWALKNNIIDYRVQFFGFNSIWSKEVTFADVILHYARLAVFNLDETVGYWVDYILERNQFELMLNEDVINDIVEDLNNHTYHNDSIGTFGLFGLSTEAMDSAIRNASRNIDSAVTYEIEFNEFLKECM